MSTQLDRIEANQVEQGIQINRITQVLGGDKGLGQKGLVTDYHETKTQVYKTKSEVGKLRLIVTGITIGINTIWTGILYLLSSK